MSTSTMGSTKTRAQSGPFVVGAIPLSLGIFPVREVSSKGLSPPLFGTIALGLRAAPRKVAI